MKPRGFIPVVIAVLISVMAVGLVGFAWYDVNYVQCGGKYSKCVKPLTITNFTQCAQIGYPVTETYPRQCSAFGKTFTEVITNTNVNSNLNSNINSATDGNTNTAVDTTGWKTYTNTADDYFIMYPANDIITEQTAGDVSIVSAAGNVLNPYINISTDNVQSFVDDFSSVTSDTTITVNGQSARRIVGNMSVGGAVLNYLFTKDGKTYSLRGTNSTTNERVFQTFTFLTDTTGWKTYTNTAQKYSIQYPNTWKTEQTPSGGRRIFCVGTGYPHCSWDLTISTTKSTIEEIVTSYHESAPEIDRDFFNIVDRQNINFNGYSATKLVGSSLEGLDNYYIYIPHNDINYLLSYNGMNSEGNAGPTILSTFTFTK